LIIFFNFCSNNIFISRDHTSLQKNKQANKQTKHKQTKQTNKTNQKNEIKQAKKYKNKTNKQTKTKSRRVKWSYPHIVYLSNVEK
jgi:hypothetical protein